jgi:hypothetical protein
MTAPRTPLLTALCPAGKGAGFACEVVQAIQLPALERRCSKTSAASSDFGHKCVDGAPSDDAFGAHLTKTKVSAMPLPVKS